MKRDFLKLLGGMPLLAALPARGQNSRQSIWDHRIGLGGWPPKFSSNVPRVIDLPDRTKWQLNPQLHDTLVQIIETIKAAYPSPEEAKYQIDLFPSPAYTHNSKEKITASTNSAKLSVREIIGTSNTAAMEVYINHFPLHTTDYGNNPFYYANQASVQAIRAEGHLSAKQIVSGGAYEFYSKGKIYSVAPTLLDSRIKNLPISLEDLRLKNFSSMGRLYQGIHEYGDKKTIDLSNVVILSAQARSPLQPMRIGDLLDLLPELVEQRHLQNQQYKLLDSNKIEAEYELAQAALKKFNEVFQAERQKVARLNPRSNYRIGVGIDNFYATNFKTEKDWTTAIRFLMDDNEQTPALHTLDMDHVKSQSDPYIKFIALTWGENYRYPQHPWHGRFDETIKYGSSHERYGDYAPSFRYALRHRMDWSKLEALLK